MDALLHSGKRWSEMAGAASGVSECLDAYDPRRTLTMYSVHARCMTVQSLSSDCATSAILGEGMSLDTLQTPISLNLC